MRSCSPSRQSHKRDHPASRPKQLEQPGPLSLSLDPIPQPRPWAGSRPLCDDRRGEADP